MQRSYVELLIAPLWEMINPAREFLEEFLLLSVKNDPIAEVVSMAAHELMENAVKYSATVEIRARAEVVDGRWVRLMVENQADGAHVPALLAEVKAAMEVSDALAYYQEKIHQSQERTDGKSGLGLARIRWEAGMSLRCEVEDGMVRMFAERRITTGP